MLIQLPIETWIDVLDWLKRRDIVKKLDQLWDRQFTKIVQDWLHKYTKYVKIGELCVEDDGMYAKGIPWTIIVPMANVEIPGNITGFKRVQIRYLDSTVLAFLRRMRPIFNNISLSIDNESQTEFRLLMPIIGDQIESIHMFIRTLQIFSTNFPAVFTNAKFLHIIDNEYKSNDWELLVNWLFAAKREDGQPRTLCLSRGILAENSYPSLPAFWQKIQERFLDPTRQSACPFFVQIYNENFQPNESVIMENVRTSEQLIVRSVKYYVNESYKLITNCMSNVTPEWLAKNTGEMTEWDFFDRQQGIWLKSMKIGPLYVEDANLLAGIENGGEEESCLIDCFN